MSDALTIEHIAKAFGPTPVLKDVSLSVAPGELTAVLGASGSGKTTMLRLIAGLARADAGAIAIGGRPVDADGHFVPPERRRVGYLPQEGALFPHLTVTGNIGFALERDRLRRRTRVSRERVRELVEMVGLEGLERRYPYQLSGGERQRAALARALASEPHLVLLDEPFSSLDAELRASVRHQVLAVLRATETTAVFVTHDQDEALSAADRVALLQDGVIAQHDPPSVLYREPVNLGVARFVGDCNLLEARLERGRAASALGTIPIVLDQPVDEGSPLTVLVRPEQIVIEAVGAATDGTSGVVVGREFHGHDLLLAIRPDAGQEPIFVRVMGSHPAEVGQAVTIRLIEPALAWPLARV